MSCYYVNFQTNNIRKGMKLLIFLAILLLGWLYHYITHKG